MLHGWSGYRTGPHQMLARAAKIFAQQGHAVLRFDFAGRGDSDGEAQNATLATMADDTRAALQWCAARGYEKVILLGLCSGCEVAFACASDPDVRALALWSAPVFAAGQGDDLSRGRKRAENLKAYARKALKPATWRKVLTGRVDVAGVQRAASGGGGETARNVEDGSVGNLPRGWRARGISAFGKFRGPRLLIYGTADPATETSLEWHLAQGSCPTTEHFVEGANHSFYGLAWESEVIATTARWLTESGL
jgi:pimeloyl-ACP methyl ester carboxylesterase